MSVMQWIGIVAFGLLIICALVESFAEEVNLSFTVIIVLTVMLIGSFVSRRETVNKTVDIIEECLESGNTAKFRNDVYIGCFKKSDVKLEVTDN
jgi:hypothetical protein